MKLKYIFLFSLLKALRAGFKAQAPFQVSSFKFQVKGQRLIFHSSPFTFHLLLNPSKSFKSLILFSLLTFHFSLFTFNVTPVHAQRILSLQECCELAEQNNIKSKDARHAIETADEQKKYAFSKYLPEVNVTGLVFKSNKYLVAKENFSDFIEEIIDAFESSTPDFHFGFLKNYTGANISVVEPIYTGGKLTRYNKLADVQKDVRQLQWEVTKDELYEQVEKYYYTLLSLYSKQKIIAMADSELVHYHKDAKNALEMGIVNKSDLLTVELEQNKNRSLKNKLVNGISLLKRALAQFIGLDGEDIDVDTTLLMKIEAPEMLLANHLSALEQRHETALLDKNVEAQQLYKRIAQADNLPTLAIMGSAVWSDVGSTRGTRFNALAMLRIPISAFWSNKHEVKVKKIAVQQAKDLRDEKRQMMLLQMQDAFDKLTNAYEEIQLSQKAIEKANENLRMNEDYYSVGTINMTNLLDAQRLQQQALDQYNDAVCEYQMCRSHYLIVTARSEQSR